MARVIFTISYEIDEAQRADYLETAEALKNYLTEERGKNYSIYEVKGKANNFSEVYICASMEEYDTLEEDSDDITEQLIDRINNFVKKAPEYRILVEAV